MNDNNQNQQPNVEYQNNSQPQPTVVNQYYNTNTNTSLGIKERNVVTAILLSIITCGIYGLIWFASMTDDSNRISDEKTASGGTAILYTILTCGIYSFYWSYKMGRKLYNGGKKYGKDVPDNSTLYLILCIFGLGIVTDILVQTELNKFADQ